MVLLTALWGLQQVVIKLTAADVSVVMQAGVRSVIATVLVLAWAWRRKTALWESDGTLGPGLLAGLLFAGEFVFIYAGLEQPGGDRRVRELPGVVLASDALSRGAPLGVFVPRASVWRIAGVVVLGEPLRPLSALSAALVVGGIVLVNLRAR